MGIEGREGDRLFVVRMVFPPFPMYVYQLDGITGLRKYRPILKSQEAKQHLYFRIAFL